MVLLYLVCCFLTGSICGIVFSSLALALAVYFVAWLVLTLLFGLTGIFD